MTMKLLGAGLVLAGGLIGCSQASSTAPGTVQIQDAVQAQGAVSGVTYQGPILIEKGGTYRGNWESLDPGMPAVVIKTDEPVTIEDSNIRGKGVLIQVPWDHGKLTVRGSRAEGLNPNVPGRTQGRFIQVNNNDSLVVEHNEVVGTLGIQFNSYQGNRDGQQTIKVRYNRFLNIMGQASDGQGGYRSGNTRGPDWDFASAVQLDNVKDVPGIEVAWNEVINEPRKSRVEDVISFCDSGGAPQSRAEVHDNYIQGGYAYNPAEPTFFGAGINAGDCGDGTLFGYVRAHDNQVVGFAGGGIGINAGHDTEVFGNRVVSAGRLADGTTYPAIGLAVWDYYQQGKALFYGNRSHDNVVGVVRHVGAEAYRCDGWWPEEAKVTDDPDVWCKGGWFGNVSLPDPVTLDTERAEFTRWQAKLRSSGVILGPVGTRPGNTAGLAVTVYADPNLKGTAQRFGVGSYNSRDLNVVGNDRISSLSVPAGLKLRACQHNGGAGICRTYLAGEYKWPGDDLNDQISHLKVSTAAP
jgi:hypothetical protein